MQRRRPSGWPIAALLIALMIAAFLAWTVVARLDEVAIAQGEVVPLGQNKVVQHFEGGIIKRIYVREGEHVTVDQPLVLIDLGTTGLDSSEIELRLDAHHLKKARLVAELGSDDPSYPANAAARRPQIVESENRTLELRRSQLRTAANSLESQIRSHEAEMADMRRERSALDSGLAVARESLALSDSLIKDNLIPKIHHLERQQEVDRLVAQRHRLDGSLRRAEGELTRARGQLDDLRLTYWREASEELTSVEAEIARLQGGMARANEQQSRTEVRSPIEGVVKGLRYHTLGGVIGPGVPIMEIVPLDDQLLVEARLDPRDIGYVREGQSAVVKVSTYDYVRYGGLEGVVKSVAPDATTDQSGNHYFRVLVETEKSSLGPNGEFPIIPGMLASVDIHTGTRTLLEFLVRPILKLRHEALRER
jgi:adhesin transport system membrane fusion protein